MMYLLKLFRCDTVEKCRRIQAGFLPLRRLGRWSVLFTIAFTLWINDAIGFSIDKIFTKHEQARGQYMELREQYTKATGSVFYRWTIGWYVPSVNPPDAPKLDEQTLAFYRIVNALQFTVFLMCCLYSLRWVYADFIANGQPKMFWKFCVWATLTNITFYYILRLGTSHLLNQVVSN